MSKKKKQKQNNAIPPEIKEERKFMVKNGLSESILGYEPAASIGTQLSQVDTLFKNNRWYLVSNMRQLLSQMYVEHGLIQTVVDIPVDDALRGGVTIKTKQLDDDEITEIENKMAREGDLDIVAQALKWNRLFGGAGIVLISGQKPDSELNIEKLYKKDFEFRAVDMWELFWSHQVDDDYSAAIDQEEVQKLKSDRFYDYYGKRLHNSRVLRLIGLRAPSFIRPRLRGWGFSVVESLVRSINGYLKSNNLTFEVLDEFKVDIFKIHGLANTLLTKDGTKKVRDRVQLANREKNYQHAITMDGEDDYQQKQLTFSGLADVMEGLRIQIASDLRMPMTKLFGVSSAGFNAGEDDIENYNAMIESTIRSKIKFEIIKMIEMRCQQIFGITPDDLDIEFQPLRVLSSEQEQNVKNAKFNRLLQAAQAGLISVAEFKDACNRDDLLPVKIEADDNLYKELSALTSSDVTGLTGAGGESTLNPKGVKS